MENNNEETNATSGGAGDGADVATAVITDPKGRKTSRVLEPRECANPNCDNQYVPKTVASIYCSNSCRAQASKIRLGQAMLNGAPTTETKPEPTPEYKPVLIGAGKNGEIGQFHFAQMMIDHHANEVRRWEKKYEVEVADHKETKKKLDDLLDEKRQSDKPSALQGFLGSEGGVAIINSAAPLFGVLAKLLEGKVAQPGIQQVAGADGQQPQASQFELWVGSLTPEAQQAVVAMLNKLMSLNNEQRMVYMIDETMKLWHQQI